MASVDGRIEPTEDARIPPHDDGLLRGDGVFEVIKIYAGRPHAMDDHLDRMQRSADAIHLDFPRDQVEEEATALLEESGEIDSQLRLIVTRGGRRLAFVEPLVEWPATAKVATVSYSPTVILTGVKSLSYGANMHSTRLAKEKGADESVLVRPDGVVLEGPTCAIFWAAEDGTLHTPSLEVGILDSIVRDRIVGELDTVEGEYQLDELLAAREAFLASTTREVQPISEIDGKPLPEVPGPRTVEAQDAFAEVLKRELAD